MTVQDDTLAADPSHRVAMNIQAIMSAVGDLYDVPCRFLGSDVTDLQLAHARLGYLLDSLKMPKAIR